MLTARLAGGARRSGARPRKTGRALGIHLGMGGRIVVTSPDGLGGRGAARLGGADAQPRKAEWDRFTLSFADGGSLVLFDKRRLGRVRLNPGIDALGPDAAEVTPAEFRDLITRGSVAVKARLLEPVQDRRRGEPAGRRDPLAGQGVTGRADRTACGARTRTGCTALSSRLCGPPSPRAGCIPAMSSRPGIPAGPARGAAPRCGTERSAAARPGGARASRSRRKGRHPGPFGLKNFDPERGTRCPPIPRRRERAGRQPSRRRRARGCLRPSAITSPSGSCPCSTRR